MCGLAGLMTHDGTPAGAAILAAMEAALAHRGPDGAGSYAADDVAMSHRRLAIIDLVTGDQPLHGEDGLALVANGEIYNHLELRAAMPEVRFATGSDCEPPLALYRRHGLDFAAHLRGMYAIALHDRARRRLVLSRDPFGIKPLYYAETAQGFLFASEPQAILASGLVPRRMRGAARDELLALQYTTGPETIFDGIRRLLPGETVAVQGGRVVDRRRLPALPEGGVEGGDEAEARARLEAVLIDSVTLHQRSDVPYGMFLSGGIDSAAVLALMARLNSRPVLAFTACFPGTGARDESEHARSLARRVGADHVEVAFSEADFWDLLPGVAAAMDDPAADYAILPTYKLAATARASVKVILSGEGGDELFAGYGRYRAAARPWPLARTMRPRGHLHGLGLLRDESDGWRASTAAAEQRERAAGRRSRLQAAQAVDCADWLPNDLLLKLDRCLMAHGIEGRVPFLDCEVARLAFRLPDRLKLRGRLGKWLLRAWLAEALPEAKPFSAKRGFTVPVEEWLARRPELGPLLAGRPAIAEVCRPGAVEALFRAPGKKAGFAIWTLLFYALWHRRHIQGLAPAGGVFDTLSQRD
jgi:asparagine synthase (glutamine-hydrolysing)